MFLNPSKGMYSPSKHFILKSGHIGHINSFRIGCYNKFFYKFGRNCYLSYFLVPETMSPLYVQSKVCMAPFHVRSKVCIAPIHVGSKVCKFAPHMDGSNTDIAPHIKWSHADFVSHMEWRHSFRDQIIAKTTSFANFNGNYLNHQYFKSLYDLGDHL